MSIVIYNLLFIIHKKERNAIVIHVCPQNKHCPKRPANRAVQFVRVNRSEPVSELINDYHVSKRSAGKVCKKRSVVFTITHNSAVRQPFLKAFFNINSGDFFTIPIRDGHSAVIIYTRHPD